MNERANLVRGIVSARYGRAPIRSERHPPSAALDGVVSMVWAAEWDLRGRTPHTIQLVADPCVNLAIEAGRSRVVGVWTTLWNRTLEETGAIRAVKLRPGAFGRAFPGSAQTLTDEVRPLAEVLPVDVNALEAMVLGPSDAVEGLDALQRWLAARLRADTEASRFAIAAVERVAADASLRTVEQLCDEVEVPRRTLQRLFRDHVGASPRWVIRHHRLQEAATRLVRGEFETLAGLSSELGYSDQAHFTREFRRVVGKPPGAFLAGRVAPGAT